jgi:hypothetical protein
LTAASILSGPRSAKLSRAPDDKLFALKEPFNRIGAAEARNAEEGREK